MKHTISWYIGQQASSGSTEEEREKLVNLILLMQPEELVPPSPYELMLADQFVGGQITVMQLLTLAALAPRNP